MSGECRKPALKIRLVEEIVSVSCEEKAKKVKE